MRNLSEVPLLESRRKRHSDHIDVLRGEIEEFFKQFDACDANVVLHSTGVNFAYQFYVLSLIGARRLNELKSLHLISGGAIATVVWHAHHVGALQWTKDQAVAWERHFFRLHRLTPWRASLRVPARLARSRPLLCNETQRDVIESAVGKPFFDAPLSQLPRCFHFWLYNIDKDALVVATPQSEHAHYRTGDTALAAISIPWVFGETRLQGARHIDPVFSAKKDALKLAIAKLRGPTLISNMIVERRSATRRYIRPHPYANGGRLMATELFKFCAGLSNADHVAALYNGLALVDEDGSRRQAPVA